MARAIVGRWGKNLAVRVPVEVARTLGLGDGEIVDIDAVDDTLVIRRTAGAGAARDRARTAAAAIIADRPNYPLGDVSLRDLIAEGRRG